MPDLKSAPLNMHVPYVHTKFFQKIGKVIIKVFIQYSQIWAFRSKIWKTKISRIFQISRILKLWVVLGRFAIFWGRFSWFQLVLVVFESLWLVLCFSRYMKVRSVTQNYNYLFLINDTTVEIWYFKTKIFPIFCFNAEKI